MTKDRRIVFIISRFFRNNGGYLCFLFIFTAFFYANALLTNYWLKLEMVNSYNNTPYNAYSKTFLMDSKENILLDLSDLGEHHMLEDCVLFRYHPEVQSIYEVIYCSEDAISLCNSNISQWNFISKEKIAVVGFHLDYKLGDIISRNDKDYLVKGILDKHISQAVNYGVFYANNEFNSVDTQYTYILTSQNYNSINNAFENLQHYLLDNNVEIKEIQIRDAEFKDYIKYDKIILFICLLLIMFYLLLISIAKKVWLKYKRPEILVLTILGDPFIKTKVYLPYILIWLSAFVLELLLVSCTVDTLYFGYYPITIVSLITLAVVLLSMIKMYKPNQYML